MENDLYMMWLSRINGVGSRKIEYLLSCFGSASKIYSASRHDLCNLEGMNLKDINSMCASKASGQFEKWTDELEKKKINYISIENPLYPPALRNIFDPPMGLYIKGNFPSENLNYISVVGARRCTQYGSQAAYKISKDLAEHKCIIVSGMARGIDTMAHRGALDAKSKTVAVFGCGLDICYPPENIGVMNRITENGCVVSEYPPQTEPFGGNFPRRNRIIGGISEALIVVEAEMKSGTLSTVDQALENGRTVFAIPGNIFSPSSMGTNNLIKQGCPIVTCFEDVLNELGIEINCKPEEKKSILLNKLPSAIDNEEGRQVLECLGLEPIDFEILVCKTKVSVQTLQYILTILEINKLVVKLPGQRYILAL